MIGFSFSDQMIESQSETESNKQPPQFATHEEDFPMQTVEVRLSLTTTDYYFASEINPNQFKSKTLYLTSAIQSPDEGQTGETGWRF